MVDVPSSLAEYAWTGPWIETSSMRLFIKSCRGTTVTPPAPFVKPFFVASAYAALKAPTGFPGRYTTPASAAASAARCMRMRFSSNQLMSTPMPMIPRSIVMSRAATTIACPRSSLTSRIERHHGGVTHVERPESRDEEAKRRTASVEVADADAGGIRRADVISGTRRPGVALLHEVETLPGDERPGVCCVGPLIRETCRLRPARRRLVDSDRAHVRERDLCTRTGEHSLDGGDDQRIHRRGVRRLVGCASKRSTPVDERAGDASALAGRGRDGHGLVDRRGELDDSEHEHEQQREKKGHFGDRLAAFVAKPHSVGSMRTPVLRCKMTVGAIRCPNDVTHWCA